MAKALRDDLVWQDVDVEALKGPVKKAYDAYKAASRAASAAREEFETKFRGEAAKKLNGDSCLFSHKFGKLSIARVSPEEVKATKVSRPGKFAL